MLAGRSAAVLYLSVIPKIASQPEPRLLSEQKRRQALPPRLSQRVFRSPGFEKLNQLLARRILVPGPVLAHDLEKLVHRRMPLALRVKRERQLEARVPIAWIEGDGLLKAGDICRGACLLCQLQRRLGAEIGFRRLFCRRHESERLFGAS